MTTLLLFLMMMQAPSQDAKKMGAQELRQDPKLTDCLAKEGGCRMRCSSRTNFCVMAEEPKPTATTEAEWAKQPYHDNMEAVPLPSLEPPPNPCLKCAVVEGTGVWNPPVGTNLVLVDATDMYPDLVCPAGYQRVCQWEMYACQLPTDFPLTSADGKTHKCLRAVE